MEKEKNYFEQIGSHKGSFILYLVLRIAIAVVMAIQIWNHDWQNVFICIASLILFLAPSFVESKFRILLPAMIQNILLLFIFCAEILGEIEAFYVMIPWWDTMLHTINGFIVAALGFSLVNLLNESERVIFKLSPAFVAIVAFCFSMTVGVCWEFGEYAMDRMFCLDIGLYDTMGDLWVNFVGALAFSLIGYQCLKSEEKKKFLENFMVKKEEQQRS